MPRWTGERVAVEGGGTDGRLRHGAVTEKSEQQVAIDGDDYGQDAVCGES